MPCFVSKIPRPSHQDYEAHKLAGYTGTYEQYLAQKQKYYDPHAVVFMCGSMEGFEYCSHTSCIGFNVFLCDYPMGDGKTCDYGMCEDHSHQIGEDLHYCQTHYQLWLNAKPKELHVEEVPIGYLVDQVFYPVEKKWVAENKSLFLNKPIIRVFAEKE